MFWSSLLELAATQNLYGVLTIIALLMITPFALLVEGRHLISGTSATIKVHALCGLGIVSSQSPTLLIEITSSSSTETTLLTCPFRTWALAPSFKSFSSPACHTTCTTNARSLLFHQSTQ